MGLGEIIHSLSDNPYFGAGFGLFGVGAAAAIGKKGAQVSFIMFRRHYMTTVEVTCKDKSYNWLLQWISAKGAKDTQHLSVDTSFVESDSGKVSTKYDFTPSVGTHIMRYGKTWIRVERTRENRMLEPWETVQMTTLGKNKLLFAQILDEARTLALQSNKGKTFMYTVIGTEWKKFGHPRQIRPLNSVVLDDDVSERLVKDVKDFIDNPAWYRQRGAPYRRGWLLYGPPGCGKTSFIQALAGALEYSICVLNLSDRAMSDDRLQHRLADAPENSIVLLEDIDAAFISREMHDKSIDPKELDKRNMNESAYQGLNRLTFSGLLNAIDGVTSTEGRILFMTTNYVERLDPALIRPGRVDFKQYIGHNSHNQCVRMFGNFFPDETKNNPELPVKFADKVMKLDTPVSAAQVQGMFMFYKNDPCKALENVFRLQTPIERTSKDT